MMEICPAGPPKLIKPSFSQNLKASLKEGWAVYSVSKAILLEELLLMPLAAIEFIDTCFEKNQLPED